MEELFEYRCDGCGRTASEDEVIATGWVDGGDESYCPACGPYGERVEDEMDDTPATTLRNRAAAAVSARRLQDELNQKVREEEREQKARTLLWDALGVAAEATRPQSLPFDIDGLLFDCSQYGECWRLNLLRPCIECSQMYATAINELADLGELLDDGPGLCGRCDC